MDDIKKNDIYNTLSDINVKEHIKKIETYAGGKKVELSYLSWTWAWDEIKKQYPDVTYQVKRFGENNLPYVYDNNTGYMVFTSVTINGMTHDMWLPVMNSSNRAMKSEPYVYTTKKGDKIRVEAATMFDINKTIMRCLVKNLAMFGLGLYIYAGEDLPENEQDTNAGKKDIPPKLKKPEKAITSKPQKKMPETPEKTLAVRKLTINNLIKERAAKENLTNKDIVSYLTKFVGKDLKDINTKDADEIITHLNQLNQLEKN